MTRRIFTAVVYLSLTVASVVAQTPAPAPADASATPGATPAAAPGKNPWAVGPFVFSALVDGYYSYNHNDPGNETNLLRNFDTRSGTPTLSLAKFSLDAPAAPIGFHIDAGFGRTLAIIESSAPGGPLDGWKQLLQAYVSIKPKSWKGVQVDFGKFYTSAGAEVTETNADWNYSRSLLFAFGPYYHTGLRVNFPVGKTFSGGVQVVEGWNGYDGKNHGATLGLTGAWNPSTKVSWANNYYVGPEDVFGVKSQRNYFDTALTINPNSKTSYYINFDAGHDKFDHNAGKANYYGIAGAGRYQLAKHFAVAARGEVYKDSDGFWTGSRQTIKEFTFTGEYKHSDYFLTRVEYRKDLAEREYFPAGRFNLPVKNQSTFLVGMVAYIGPKK